jgi:hypothetical protein
MLQQMLETTFSSLRNAPHLVTDCLIMLKVLGYKLWLLRDDSYRQSYRRVYGTFINLENS